jgi:hypothetical protein
VDDEQPPHGADRLPDIFEEGGQLPESPALAGDPFPDDDDAPMPFGDSDVHDILEDPLDGDADTTPDAAHGAPGEFTPVAVPVPAAGPAGGDEDLHGAPGETPRGGWKRPPKKSLQKSAGVSKMPAGQVRETSKRLLEALAEFGVSAEMVNAVSGPRVTRYEIRLAPGTKVSKVASLRDDLAYALAATDELRILAPIPGKQAVGVEVRSEPMVVVVRVAAAVGMEMLVGMGRAAQRPLQAPGGIGQPEAEQQPGGAVHDAPRRSPWPSTTHFIEVSPSRPTGPRAWNLSVLMPISAPRPYSKPSAKRVLAFTITLAESTSRRKRMAAAWFVVRMASVWWLP